MPNKLGYGNLKAWERCDESAKAVYKASAKFPKEETYALTSQIRRASLSAPTNIVEGYARKGRKEFRHFLSIASASLAETGYLLEFAGSQGYLSEDEFKQLADLRDECSRVVWGLLESQTVR
jgi:four helix bundle protein